MGSHLSEHLDHVPWPGWPHVTPGVLGPTSPMALMKGAASLGGHRDHQTLGSGRKRGGAGTVRVCCPSPGPPLRGQPWDALKVSPKSRREATGHQQHVGLMLTLSLPGALP